MPYNSNLVRLIFLATFAGEAFTLWLVYKRGLKTRVPWFAGYLSYMLARDCVFYFLWEWGDKMVMFYTVWILEIGAALLITAFIMEMFRAVFVEHEAARKLGRNVLLAGAVILVLIAVSTIGHGSDHATALMKVIMVTERSVRLVHLGIIVTFFALVRFLGLPLRQYQFGVLIGYGLYSAANLAIAAFNAEMGSAVGYKTYYIEAVAFICMFLIWISYLSQEEPVAPSQPPSVGPDDLDRYRDALSSSK